MSLFSTNKNSDPGKQPSKKRDMVTVVCPDCQHEQREPKIALSTYCRGCGSYYKMSRGKALPGIRNPSNPFASLSPEASKVRIQEACDPADFKKNRANKKPVNKPLPSAATDSTTTPADSPSSPASRSAPRPHNKPGKETAAIPRLFHKKTHSRSVQCFDCAREHVAPAQASSTLCPACGSYIGLKDYVIRDQWNRRIQTRGNVTILRKASVTGVNIRCHHLFVQGTLKGGVDCSGDFVLSSHSRIIGKVRCKRLIIEKKAQVAFANEIECEDAIIDGNVTGHFICSGKLHLKKKAVLSGNIKVATMAIDKGARHNGKISIGN